MLDAAEKDELRDLQHRAYARGGGLTDAEAERLRALEHERFAAADPPALAQRTPAAQERLSAAQDPGSDAIEAPVAPVSAAAEGSAPVEGSAPAAGAQAPAEPSTPLSARPPRRRWALLAGALAIAAVGVGVSWLLFGDRGPAPFALTPEQRTWEDALLASAEYDTGSLRAVAEVEGVVVWFGTKKEGELACVILSDGRNTRPTCTTAEDIAVQGLYGQFRTPAGDDEREVNAQVVLDAEGDPAVVVSSYLLDSTNVGVQYATEQEENIAAKLTEAGFDPGSLWVVGYDGDVPLWSGLRSSHSEQCLIYDGSQAEPEMTCADTDTLWNDGGSLVIDRAGADSGVPTRFAYVFHGGSTYLTITTGIEPGDAPG